MQIQARLCSFFGFLCVRKRKSANGFELFADAAGFISGSTGLVFRLPLYIICLCLQQFLAANVFLALSNVKSLVGH